MKADIVRPDDLNYTRPRFSRHDAAEYLGLSIEVLMRHAKAGRITYTKLGDSPSSLVRFSQSALDDFLRRGTKPAVTDPRLVGRPVRRKSGFAIGLPSKSAEKFA